MKIVINLGLHETTFNFACYEIALLLIHLPSKEHDLYAVFEDCTTLPYCAKHNPDPVGWDA